MLYSCICAARATARKPASTLVAAHISCGITLNVWRLSMPRPSRPKRDLICAECSKPFSVEAWRKDTTRFCRPACHDTWRYKKSLLAFWAKMHRCDHEECCPYCCWPWKGVASDDTYGLVHIRNQGIGAHRIAWELFNERPFPADLHGAHYCHRKSCTNPLHIHPTTREGNYEDSIRDHRLPTGENHHNSKLTEETALEAFRLKVSGLSNKDIAHNLHVSTSTIGNLMAGLIWKHLPRPEVLPKLKPGPRAKNPFSGKRFPS